MEEVCGAGLEPVTSHHPRAWGISVRDLRPRGRPARLNHAQVPAEDGVVPGTNSKKLGSSLGRQAYVSNLLSAHSVFPVTNCSAIEGAEYSPCGPPCPRSCDDLVVSLVSHLTFGCPEKHPLGEQEALGSWSFAERNGADILVGRIEALDFSLQQCRLALSY